MYQMSRVSRISMSALFSVLLFFIILNPCNLNAQEKTVFDAIQVIPATQAKSAQVQWEKTDIPSPDPRAQEIARKMGQVIRRIKTGSASDPGGRAKPAHLDRYVSRVKSKRPDMEVRFRPISGTPRQIRLKQEDMVRRHINVAKNREGDEDRAGAFLRSVRGLLRIKDPDKELNPESYDSDHLGRRHLRFSQKYRDLPVWPAELIIHLDENGNPDLLNGAIVPTPYRISEKPLISDNDAVEKACASVFGAKAEFAGVPELIIYAPGHRIPRLAWKTELIISPASQWLVVTDAMTGKILNKYNQVPDSNVRGTGTDLSRNTRQLNLWKEGSTYYMTDTTKPMFSGSGPVDTLESGSVIILDLQNQPENAAKYYVTSSAPSSGWLPDAVSAMHNMSLVYDYFLERHNRNSLNNNGLSVVGIVRTGQNFYNAYFSPGHASVFFGDAEPYAQSVDLAAHEMTHGVTSFTAGLIYENQSGALNEAFSDIFGQAAEVYARGAGDWIHCTDCGKSRNLADPNANMIPGTNVPRPATMSQFISPDDSFLDIFTNRDNGGVHINCTIVAHAFYLLADGLDQAIGIQKAERIAYRALTTHLVSKSQFIDARLAFISSAEELFGKDSPEASKTAEAFDAVEIFDESGTPVAPPSLPPVLGADSTVFVSYRHNTLLPLQNGYYLGRCEKGLNPECAFISSSYVALSRPTVTGDGTIAAFVSSANDLCFLSTDGTSTQDECMGFLGHVASAAMSPDSMLWGFVFLDASGNRTNSISVIDYRQNSYGKITTYNLVSPTDSDVSLNTILYADTIEFSADGKFLIYDALNDLTLSDGTQMGVWSIYKIDLETGQTHVIVPPIPGLDIGFPALGQTNDNIITFEAVDQETWNVGVFAANLITGDLKTVALLKGHQAIPTYSGDDSQIIYTKADNSTYTGLSLWAQAIDQDHITPVGDPGLYISDAGYGIIYRRGTFTPPEPDISVSPETLSFGDVYAGDASNLSLTFSNAGTADLEISSQSMTGTNADEFSTRGSGCSGRTLPATGTCKADLIFSPVSEGAKSAILSVQSDDPDTPVLNIQISGTGLSPGTTTCRGDVNHDGSTDLKDALLSLKICVGFIPSGVDRTCDINGDGRVGLHEAVNALQHSSGLRDSLLVP